MLSAPLIVVMSKEFNDAQTPCWNFSQASGWEAPGLVSQSTSVSVSPALRSKTA